MTRAALLAALLGALLVPALPAAAQPADPLRIAADNMTGSHGPEGDIVLLNGNVVITRGRTVITAERGRYLRALGMLHLEGQVRMRDSSATVTCDRASYSELDDVLRLDGNVVVRDREAVLRAPAGVYDRRTGRADLMGPVEAVDGTQHLLADQAVYWRDSMLVQARGNVRGRDEENDTVLRARAVDYDREARVAVATGDPELEAKDEDGRSTFLRALKLTVNTQSRVAEAVDSVRVVRDTLQARADRALFDDGLQRGWLTGNPRVWDDETHVTGDSLEFQTEERRLKRAIVRGNAVVDYAGTRPNTAGEASRLGGRRVDVWFTGEEIDSLVAMGEARNEYQAVARAGQTPERNVATGDTITVFFEDREIDRARVEGGAKGEYRMAVDVADTAAARREVVAYDARRIEFQVPRSLIVLAGDAHLTYGDLELLANRVEFDVDRQTLVAQGNPVLHDRGDRVTGHMMTYDLDSRVGTIYQAETTYEKGLYHGERIRKVGENELDIMEGAYSTCDLERPHYHFSARWMKIYIKDKLVAKPVVFYVRKVPVFALPFWVFPIKPGRHSGFLFPQFEFGFNNRAGQFIRNAGYYWAPNDYMDVTFSGDYYQAEPSWVLRAESYYKWLYVLDGNFRATYAKNEALGREGEDWDFVADHSQEISPRTRLSARAQFVSSRDYSSSPLYGRSLSERLDRFLTSSLSLTHNADWVSVNAALLRREDLDADLGITDFDGPGPYVPPVGTEAPLANLSETLPDLSISFPTRIIGSLGFLRGTPFERSLRTLYFSLNSRFMSLRERRAVVTAHTPTTPDSGAPLEPVIGQSVITRRGLTNAISLSDSRRPFGWLNLQPRLNANVVVFDFDELGNKVVPAATWSSGVTMSTTLYGTFRPTFLGLEGVRHILQPSAGISYSPEFPGLTYTDSLGIRRERFSGFGGISISGHENARVDLGLTQRFQVKYMKNGKLERLDNLLSWSMNSSYNFLWREQRQAHPFSPINSSVFLQPPGLVNASLSWVTDPYQARPVRSLGFNSGFTLQSGGRRAASGAAPELPVDRTERGEPTFRENWSVGLAYSYSGGYPGTGDWSSQQTANAVARWQLSPAWAVEYSTSYDITFRQVQTQRFSLSRDLHCWQATFTRSFTPGGESEYYFRLGIKDQREIYIERGTRFGSLGGIQ